mgnify:CR=1 FL=1|tara:strand:- start:488 stop:1645 length:1158 start_codon:yes stop_codon:yes gene_type:complete
MAISFEEYVNSYYGGTLGIANRYGIMRKADDDLAAYTSPATNFAQRSDYFNTMYGAAVFNQLNTESEVFKLLPKEGWTQSGWRILHKRHATTAGQQEGAAFPDTDTPELKELEANLKEVVTPWRLSTRAELLSGADDGVKGLLQFLRRENAEAHSYYIDQMLMKDCNTPAGNNMESIDRIVSKKAENGVAVGDPDIYGVDRSESGSGASNDSNWADATVDETSSSTQTFALGMIDGLVQSALQNGANYNDLIILTGHDTYTEMKQLMSNTNAAWQYNLTGSGAGSQGGVSGKAGINFDSRVGYYDGIPIFVSQHVLATERGTIKNLYLLDMAHLKLKIAAPTTYVDNQDLGVLRKLAKDFAFITSGELIATKFKSHGKLRDLAAP